MTRQRTTKQRKVNRVCVLLVVLNLITMAMLLAIGNYYRLPRKLYRRIFTESRIPYFSPVHENNRFYDIQRQIFLQYPTEHIRVIVAGDSLVSLAAWNELLRRPDVAGRGINGDTSTGLLHRIGDYSNSPIDICVLLIGTNDILLHRPEPETDVAYHSLVEQCTSQWPHATILCVSIPPLARWVESVESRNQRIGRFNRMMKHYAREFPAATLIDFASRVTDSDGYVKETDTADGVHLSAAAYATLRDLLLPHITSTANRIEATD